MKTVLITGASRGIGKATAQRFLDNGDFVIGTSLTGTIDLKHENLAVVQIDLSKPESIKECVEKITNLQQPLQASSHTTIARQAGYSNRMTIDILINNAGIVVEEEVDEPRINVDYLRRTLEVNLIGIIDFTEGVIPLMNQGGHIVNISSHAGSLGYTNYTKNYPAYRISKTALNMFTRILAVRLDGKIKVSSVDPGSVKTDMNPDGRLEPSEVAEDIFKLANSKVETGQFWHKGEKFPW